METENASYGLARITKYLPTAKAEACLHCCHTAGWHSCNRTYRQNYPAGVNCVLMVCTLKGGGWMRSGEKQWELKPGSIATVPPGTPIEYGTSIQKKEDNWEFYWLNLTGDISFLNARKIWEGDGMIHLCRNPSFFQQIFRWLHEPDGGPAATETERSARLQELFHHLLCELFSIPTPDFPVHNALPDRCWNTSTATTIGRSRWKNCAGDSIFPPTS